MPCRCIVGLSSHQQTLINEIEPLRKPWNILCCLFNLFLPGIGTLIMAMKHKFIPIQFIIGLLQLIAFWTVICYLWSVWWGILICRKQRSDTHQKCEEFSQQEDISFPR